MCQKNGAGVAERQTRYAGNVLGASPWELGAVAAMRRPHPASPLRGIGSSLPTRTLATLTRRPSRADIGGALPMLCVVVPPRSKGSRGFPRPLCAP
jgi:hypothetical protein